MSVIVTPLFKPSPLYIILCFLRFQILDLVSPSALHTASTKNDDIIRLRPSSRYLKDNIKLRPPSGNFIASKFSAKILQSLYLLKRPNSRTARQSRHQDFSAFFNSTSQEEISRGNGTNNVSSLSNSSAHHLSCCMVPNNSALETTTIFQNWTFGDDVTREITHDDTVAVTNTSETDDNAQHNAAVVVGIVFGAITAVLFIGAVSIIYVYVKRRFSHINTTCKTDLSSILEDQMTMSYIETRYDRQRNMSDEVISLDNDSFLQSLETTSLSYVTTHPKTVL